MQLSSDQCRAARGLLNWTQEELATNANVSRATVTDFESNTRRPMKNNLRSMADCMFAAGVEFLSEDGNAGVGLRFRERKLEYVTNVRIDSYNDRVTIRMRYAGQDFLCHIRFEVVDDYYHGNFQTDSEYGKAISKMQHIILAAAERNAATNIRDGEMFITQGMLAAST